MSAGCSGSTAGMMMDVGVHRGVAPPPSKWLGVVQIILVAVCLLGLLGGAGWLAGHFTTMRPEQSIIAGSFSPRKAARGYGRSPASERPLAPVRMAVTPTVIAVPSGH